MKVKLWGTRGSIPSPGPETIRYGGNTSCVGVTLSDGSLLALDAGTGIRSLGLALADEPARLHILLTHLHLDHIQGLVFFAPAFRPQTEIVIWGPASPEASLRDRIARYISAPLSPVEVRELPCDVSFRHCPRDRVGDRPGADQRRLGRPPRADARLPDRRRRPSLAYIPDHEPALGADLDTLEEDWISGFGAGPRRLAADPRRPVRRRRVPRPRRLGALLALPRTLLRPPLRRRSHGPLPPRPDALRRAPRPARRGSARALVAAWAATRTRSSSRSRGPSTTSPRGAGPSPRRPRKPPRLLAEPAALPGRQDVPEHHEHRRRGSARDQGHRGAEQDVGYQHDRPDHRQRQKGEPDEREAVGDADEVGLPLERKVIR